MSVRPTEKPLRLTLTTKAVRDGKRAVGQHWLPTLEGRTLAAAQKSAGSLHKPLRSPLVPSTNRSEVHWFPPQAAQKSTGSHHKSPASIPTRWTSPVWVTAGAPGRQQACRWSPWFLVKWTPESQELKTVCHDEDCLSNVFLKAGRAPAGCTLP